LLNGFEMQLDLTECPGCTHLYQESIQQQAVGWQRFLRGQTATSLIEYQENYYRNREQPLTATGQFWAKKLLQ
jgi:hypothetical protein